MKKIIYKVILPIAAAAVLFIGGLYVGSLDMSANAPMLMKNERAMEASMDAMDYGAAPAVMSSGSASNASILENRKIVRTADLTLKTTAFENCTKQIETLIAENGGYIENLSQYGESTRRLSLTVRVPGEKLDEFLKALEGTGRVTSRSESTSDLTTQYQDNQARLDTLYAKRDRLNDMILKAEDVSDLIEIETAIADTQYQIDLYETSQRSIDRQVDMSTVYLNIIEETPADSANADIGLGERIAAAFASGVEGFAEFVQDVIVFIVMISPVLVLIAVIVVIILAVKKRKGKKG